MNTITINDIANWTIIFGYSSITIIAFIMTFVGKGESKKKRAFFKESILNKHKNNINIDADEFMRMIESSKIGKLTAEQVLSELLLEASTPEDHNYYSQLVRKLENIEPFGTLSKDMRTILERLYLITENSSSESDKHLLIPIRNALEKADQIETEQKRTKKINFMLTVVGLISFALSIGGLYVSLKSPSKEDIASIMKNELQNIKKVQ
ncbi:hypothetical protein [Acinetobacter baumannii]|uniref:hypothetical protein n=2 Tax=Acinetobacter baumannii TaxID=470 RepID=UPI0004465139|nr:hypothetical protein [Acinetobacter baumannii]EXD55170.1 hypothetical protein J498_0191 [Acinetobacter baumannii 781407]OTS64229.1 hypothetical protein CAS98_09335 [Acinetobacter baumannii]TPS73068.1 hypothetical protein FJU46_01145 [Acinetobacter baumannii]HAV5293777.1 hypothetical protein [Acinetobacter baumannii]